MEKITYLDIKFWERFIQSFPDYLTFIDSSISKMENYIGMYRYISSAHLKLNITTKDALKRTETDEKIKMLWKKSTEGCCRLNFDTKIPNSLELNTTEELNSIYLLGDDNGKDYEKSGVMIITPNSIDNIGYLFKDSGEVIKSERGSWKFLSESKHPFNSIIVIDPYLLSDISILENNIYTILDSILPQESAVDFHISIISNDFKNGAKSRYEILDEQIKKIRPLLKYNMTLYYDRGKIFHDRVILTNNMLIESGAGFALFNKGSKAKNSTSISIAYPYFNSSAPLLKKSYVDILNRSKKIHNITIETLRSKEQTTSNFESCWGSGVKNRLLE